jgi:alpha-1,2-mannosyltransferase
VRARWVVGLSVLAGVAVVVGMGGVWGAGMLDLTVYRMGAHALLTGGDVYAAREPATGLAFTYPMFAAMLFVPYALMPNVMARMVTTAVSLVALWVVSELCVRYVLRATHRDPRRAWVYSAPLTLVAVTAHPVLDTLLFGQINVVTTALVMVDMLVLGRPTGHGQGWLTGVATGVKLVSGLFIVYYALTGRWRAAARALAGLAATVALGFAVAPGQSYAFWTGYMLDADRVGGIAFVTNQSILGMSARLLRDPHPPGALTLGLSAVTAVVALGLAVRLYRRGEEMTAMCVVAAGSLLASPISWSHHWVWVLPAGAVLCVWALRRGAWWRWSAVVAAMLVLWVGPMRFMPKAGLRELHHNLGQEIVANCYGALAVIFLGWAVAQALRRSRPDPRPADRPMSDPIRISIG